MLLHFFVCWSLFSLSLSPYPLLIQSSAALLSWHHLFIILGSHNFISGAYIPVQRIEPCRWKSFLIAPMPCSNFRFPSVDVSERMGEQLGVVEVPKISCQESDVAVKIVPQERNSGRMGKQIRAFEVPKISDWNENCSVTSSCGSGPTCQAERRSVSDRSF